MSWLSSAWDGIKSVGSSIVGVVKKVATPALSFAAGLIPGVGPLLSKGVDILGNALLGNPGDASSDAAQASATPVSDLLAQMTGTPTVGGGPAVQAAAAAVAQTVNPPTLTDPSTASNFLGIGGSAPGIFGIGAGKSAARKQAEDAAKGEGLSPKQVKLAGQEAAANADKPGGSGEASMTPWALLGAGLFALLAL